MFDLPGDIASQLRTMARAAEIAAAQTFGFGGSTWSVARPSGTGTAPRSITVLAEVVVLYAFRSAPGGLAAVAGGTPDLDDTWRAIVVSGSVQPGDVLTSEADPRYSFSVASFEPWYEHVRITLERRR